MLQLGPTTNTRTQCTTIRFAFHMNSFNGIVYRYKCWRSFIVHRVLLPSFVSDLSLSLTLCVSPGQLFECSIWPIHWGAINHIHPFLIERTKLRVCTLCCMHAIFVWNVAKEKRIIERKCGKISAHRLKCLKLVCNAAWITIRSYSSNKRPTAEQTNWNEREIFDHILCDLYASHHFKMRQ